MSEPVGSTSIDSARAEEFVAYNTSLFRWVAPIYGIFDAILAPLRLRFVDFLELPANARVLDAATGTGYQAKAFASRGFSVTGVDLSPDMLARARKLQLERPVEFMLGNATALPFPDGAFAASVMSFALHCMPLAIRLAAVRELSRVTLPGGTVAFIDYAVPDQGPGRSLIPRVVSLYETPLYKQYIRSDFDQMLAQAGLVRVRERRLYAGAVRMTVCRARAFVARSA
jgi:SAM-dependent methyltransferase